MCSGERNRRPASRPQRRRATPSRPLTRRARSRHDQARQVNAPAAPPRTRTINTISTARTGRTARQTPTATDTRASSIEDGRPGREAREGRPREERDQLARERHARISEAGSPQDAPATPRAQDRQAGDDGRRTGTAGRPWTDQDRAGIQRFTKDAPRCTDGHRREHDAREAQPRDRRTRTTRDRDAIADVGMYRAVAYTDISEHHYDNHPYVTRRAVNRMVRDGVLEEHEATGPQGHTFTVLTATARGRDAAHRAALDAGHVLEQETWTGLVKPAELSHDTAVYRAALDERARIEAEGGRVVRVRLDAELKSLVATATEKARAEGGDRAADEAKRAAAQELGLPMQDNRVMYPDAQLEIEDADGVSGRVNVEIASDHYHAAAIVAKAGAGFALHGSSRSATRNIGRALGQAAARETDSGPGGGSPSAGRDGSVEL